MVYTFAAPETLCKLRSRADQHHHLGLGLGELLNHIKPLVSTHLDNHADYQNKIPSTLAWAPDFVKVVDHHVVYLRRSDGCLEKFPDDLVVDRKARRPRRKYLERYTTIVEMAYKTYMLERLGDVLRGLTPKQTQMFNKGIDKGISGIQWVAYPTNNVVLSAGDMDWAVWLRGRCEELGMAEVKAGRYALEPK